MVRSVDIDDAYLTKTIGSAWLLAEQSDVELSDFPDFLRTILKWEQVTDYEPTMRQKTVQAINAAPAHHPRGAAPTVPEGFTIPPSEAYMPPAEDRPPLPETGVMEKGSPVRGLLGYN